MIFNSFQRSLSEDGGSFSSTEDILKLIEQPRKQPSLQITKQRRHVRFQEQQNVSYPSIFSDMAEVKHLWYTADDYQRFKSFYIKAVQLICGMEQENQDDCFSYSRVLERVFSAGKGLPSSGVTTNNQDQQKLRYLLSRRYAGRAGLENATVRCVRLDQKARRRALITVITKLQDDREYMCASEDQRAFTLALITQTISRPSRLFAAQVGLASSFFTEEEEGVDGYEK
ncbi:hypothetical protein ACA910_011469 [Epithemia clementina (nom. ined.)]